MIDPARDSRSGPGPQLGDSLRLLLQETSVFKQQNPGKVELAARLRGCDGLANRLSSVPPLVLPAGLQSVHVLCRVGTLRSRGGDLVRPR